MNKVQIEENPDAYIPNIEKNFKRKEEMRKMEKLYEEKYCQKAYDIDKALFDFDESVDNLSQVSDRYIPPVVPDELDQPYTKAQVGEELSVVEE